MSPNNSKYDMSLYKLLTGALNENQKDFKQINFVF